MTNLTKILIGAGIVGAGVIATPMIYNSQINKFITTQTQNLKQQNIEIKESKNSDSFLEANRQYIVTIKDITPLVTKLYPTIQPSDLKNLKEAFDNTQFLVTLNLTKLPVYHKDAIKIDLYNLNKNSTKALSEDKIGKQLLQAIKDKSFEAILDINNLQIAKAKLKDINLNLVDNNSYKNETINLISKGVAYNLENNHLKISKLALNDKEKYKDNYKKTTNFSVINIDETIKKQDLLNSSTNLKIDSINLSQKSNYENNNLTLNDIKFSTNIKTMLGKTSIQNSLNLGKFTFNTKNANIIATNIVYNYQLSNLYTPAIKEIINNRNLNNISQDKLMNNLQKLIQNGIKLSISPLSVQKIEANINSQSFDIKPIKIDFNAELLKNNFSIINPDENILLKNIKAKLKIVTDSKNIDLISKINPQVTLMLAMVSKKVKNKTIINLEYENSKLTSNGKPLF